MNYTFKEYLKLSPEVESALAEGRPVLALESTILSHGMPYPVNTQFAAEAEQTARQNGAVPATCAVIDGVLRVGLSESELQRMCQGQNIEKLSRRDLPMAVTAKRTGATTVATTMILAHMAGIEVFATGGLGGVHRGAAESFDISADLQELAKTSVTVVSAGVKSILDIGLTLEYLETFGVPVIGLTTAHFPAFYSRESGFGVDYAAKDEAEAAAIVRAKWNLGLAGGVVIANPVPQRWAQPKERMDAVTAEALAAAERQGIKGKKITPFLLDYIVKATGGDSLATNRALALSNIEKGARIAMALSQTR